MKLVILLFVFGLVVPFVAEAYVGPGMGGGLIAVILGVLVSIVVGFFAICWYPIKRVFKKRQNQNKDETDSKEDDPDE